MKLLRTGLIAAGTFAFALLAGCQQPASPTTQPQKESKTSFHAPGVDVDIKSKGDGNDKDRKIDVDVKGKEH